MMLKSIQAKVKISDEQKNNDKYIVSLLIVLENFIPYLSKYIILKNVVMLEILFIKTYFIFSDSLNTLHG